MSDVRNESVNVVATALLHHWVAVGAEQEQWRSAAIVQAEVTVDALIKAGYLGGVPAAAPEPRRNPRRLRKGLVAGRGRVPLVAPQKPSVPAAAPEREK